MYVCCDTLSLMELTNTFSSIAIKLDEDGKELQSNSSGSPTQKSFQEGGSV